MMTLDTLLLFDCRSRLKLLWVNLYFVLRCTWCILIDYRCRNVVIQCIPLVACALFGISKLFFTFCLDFDDTFAYLVMVESSSFLQVLRVLTPE